MKINQLCWFMENLKSIVVWSVIGAIIVALIVLACKSKIALMAELCLICVVIVMSGIYTGFYDIRYFVNRNSIHGESTEGVHNQTLGSYNELTKTFTFTRFGFAPTAEKNKYECILEFKDKSLDFTKEENLYVNDEACDHITKDTDYIKADYRQIFLDDENNILCNDSIYITVHSNKNKLAINLTTKGGDKAVKYWRSFLIENNFKVSFGKNNRPDNTTIDVDTAETPKEMFNKKCNELLSDINNISTKNNLSKIQELQTLIKTYLSVVGYDCSTSTIKRQYEQTFRASRNNLGIDILKKSNKFCLSFSQILKTTDSYLDSHYDDRYYVHYDASSIDTMINFDENLNCSFSVDDSALVSNDTNNFYSFLLFRLRNYDEFDWMFDSNNFAGSIPDNWALRKDFEHQEDIQNYEFPVTSILVLKESSEDFVNALLKNILEQSMSLVDVDEESIVQLDLSDYFYNLIFDSDSNSYKVSNGSVIFEAKVYIGNH